MTTMCKISWRLGNWLAQIVFSFRHGYRNGSDVLRPDVMPDVFKPEYDARRHQAMY